MRSSRARGATPSDRRERLGRGEAGFSALEMVVAMSLLLVVSIIGFKAVGTVYGLSARTLDSAQSATVSDLAMHELSQEAMSAAIIFDPSQEGTNAGTNPDGTTIPSGFSLRIYTENNGIYNCVQWRLLDTGDLQVRMWTTGDNPPDWQAGTPSRSRSTLLTGLVNYNPPAPYAADTKPFVLDQESSLFGGSGSGGRLLDVDLILDQHNAETPVEIKSSIAGRDALYFPGNTSYCPTHV